MSLAEHLDKLRAFKIIAETGTMREAAAKLNVTQPSLSRLVQTLEHATGAPLLSRGRSGVVPTEAGKLLLAFADTSLKQLEDLEEKIRKPEDQLAGHLRIGSYITLAEYLWPDFIAEFQKKTPQLKISIRTNETMGLPKALEEGQIDILVDAEPRLFGDLMSWNLYEDRFQFFVKPGSEENFTPETIGSLPLIYSPLAFDHDNKKILQHVEEAGYFFREKIELDSFTSVRAFTAKGLGVGVIPQRLAEESVKMRQLKLAHLKGFTQRGFGPHGMVASIRTNRNDDPRIRFLIKSLKEWLRA